MTPTPEQLIEMLEKIEPAAVLGPIGKRSLEKLTITITLEERDALISALRQMCWRRRAELPAFGERVLILTSSERRPVKEAWRGYEYEGAREWAWYNERGLSVLPEGVIAWMPLPSPPPTEGEST